MSACRRKRYAAHSPRGCRQELRSRPSLVDRSRLAHHMSHTGISRIIEVAASRPVRGSYAYFRAADHSSAASAGLEARDCHFFEACCCAHSRSARTCRITASVSESAAHHSHRRRYTCRPGCAQHPDMVLDSTHILAVHMRVLRALQAPSSPRSGCRLVRS